jgi:hypothetical protein
VAFGSTDEEEALSENETAGATGPQPTERPAGPCGLTEAEAAQLADEVAADAPAEIEPEPPAAEAKRRLPTLRTVVLWLLVVVELGLTFVPGLFGDTWVAKGVVLAGMVALALITVRFVRRAGRGGSR